ncbi:AAA family ATPase [Glycomyces fuscus]|nr:AAA family ATPase [Glycomyces fuscus]
MILSILATVAVLTAIAVIVAALVFAETALVYTALGLAGVSVLLLLGALLQGRSGGGGRPDRTDGLGKSSVPVMAATAAAAVPTAHVESEHLGRVPAPASEPVREPRAPERPAWPTPSAEDAGHGEPEYDVPRWETPTAHDWPEPDTAAHGAVPSAEPAPSWTAPSEEEQPLRAPAPWESADETAGWDDGRGGESGTAAEDGPGTGDETGEHTASASASAFTYDIPGRSPAGDGSCAQERSPSGEDAVEEEPDEAPFADTPQEDGGEEREQERGGSVFASEEPFVYSIPRPADPAEEHSPEDGEDEPGARDAASSVHGAPGRSLAEETVEEDVFTGGEDTGAFVRDAPDRSSAGDGPSREGGSRPVEDAAQEDPDGAPFADTPEERGAGDTAAAGADTEHEPDEAPAPAADHEDAPEQDLSERDPEGTGTDRDEGPETAVLPVASDDSGPEGGQAVGGGRDDDATGDATDRDADGVGADGTAGDADDRPAEDDSDDGRGAGGAFSYRIPRSGDEDGDGARPGEPPTAAGSGDGPDGDGAEDDSDHAPGSTPDDSSDTER